MYEVDKLLDAVKCDWIAHDVLVHKCTLYTLSSVCCHLVSLLQSFTDQTVHACHATWCEFSCVWWPGVLLCTLLRPIAKCTYVSVLAMFLQGKLILGLDIVEQSTINFVAANLYSLYCT